MGFPVNQDAAARGGLPTVQVVPLIAPAVVVILHPALCQDLWYGQAVAEGVRLIVQIQAIPRNVQKLCQVAPGVEQVTSGTLPRGHVFICLHPCRGRYFPAALMDPFLDFLQHLWVVLGYNLIHGRLRLGKAELRVLIHQVQYCAESLQCNGNSLIVPPHPVHVDVGVACTDNRELLGCSTKLFDEHSFRLLRSGLSKGTILCSLPSEKLFHILNYAIVFCGASGTQLLSIAELSTNALCPVFHIIVLP